MNEITRIHLAKTPYNIEVEAARGLRAYLDAIEKALHADVDAMREIELRMSELLTERGVQGEIVITAADVEALQKQLGDPKDFAGDDNEENSGMPSSPKKRLMRDTNNAMLGGVCSGVAAYFGWDVVWVRVAAVILTFLSSGTMILIYLIMAIVMPEAKTAANRLEMSGAPVTLDTLKKSAQKTTATLEPILAKLLRIFFGLVFAAGAFISAVTVMSSVGYIAAHFRDISFYFNGGVDSGISIGLMAAGGVMLTILCTLLAKMIFTRQATKNSIIASIIVTLLGAATFGSGAAITVLRVHDFQQAITTTDVTKPLDVNGVFDGVKNIDVRSRGINLRYDVSPSVQKGTYAYNSFMIKDPKVKLTKLGDTLVVEDSFSDGNGCSSSFVACGSRTVDINLTGPSVESIKTNAIQATYAAVQQETLKIEQNAATDFTLSSVGSIGTLRVQTTRGNLTASDANIGAVEVSGTRGVINLANISSLNVTADTTSCAEPLIISGAHAGTVKLNGQDWDHADNNPCVAISLNNQSSY